MNSAYVLSSVLDNLRLGYARGETWEEFFATTKFKLTKTREYTAG